MKKSMTFLKKPLKFWEFWNFENFCCCNVMQQKTTTTTKKQDQLQQQQQQKPRKFHTCFIKLWKTSFWNTFGPTCTYNMVSLFSQLGFTPYFFRCYKYVPFGIHSKVLSLCQVPGHVFYHCYERTILYPMHQENTLYSRIRQPIQILSKFLRHLLSL